MLSMKEEDVSAATAFLIVGVTLLCIISFWVQAVITEERFVPCLNIISNRWDIPDDVAAATLMAGGSSASAIVSSLMALFVTHSALGVGTIVGSEMFNQLVIIAGAVMAARNGQLQLDRAIVLREVGFYALSLGLLLVALTDRRPIEEDESGKEHLFISFSDGLILLGGYLLYMIVLAYFDRIMTLFGRKSNSVDIFDDASSQGGSVVSTTLKPSAKLPFVRRVSQEPSVNFKTNLNQRPEVNEVQIEEFYTNPSGSSLGDHSDKIVIQGDTAEGWTLMKEDPENRQEVQSEVDADSDDEDQQIFRKLCLCEFVVDETIPQPSALFGLTDLVRHEADGSFSCFLWQQSSFYNKARVAFNAWQMRWFTFYPDRFVSVPDRAYQNRAISYSLPRKIEIDDSHLLVKLYSSVDRRRDYILMAPSLTILRVVVDMSRKYTELAHLSEVTDQGLIKSNLSEESKEMQSLMAEQSPSLIVYPHGASPWKRSNFICLYPLRLALHYTIPDPRRIPPSQEDLSLSTARWGAISSIIWIIVASYLLVVALEWMGAILDIPSSIMGVTFAAAGTSIPSYIASKVAAEQGLGNLAVANVFGSNVFLIFIGLGLPWTMYTVAEPSSVYTGLRDDGITESVEILAAALLVFVMFMFHSGFILFRWHAYVFCCMYGIYLVYAVGCAYIYTD